MGKFSYNDSGKFEVHTVADVLATGMSVDEIKDSAPITESLIYFIGEVKRAFKGCELRGSANESQYSIWHVYMPDDEYTMGWIDVEWDNDNEKVVYVVQSRLITNNKFNNYSSEYRYKNTTVPTVAIKNAKKYLRRFTHSEVVHATVMDCSSAVRRSANDTLTVFSDTWRKLFGVDWNESIGTKCTPIVTEMYRLLDSGYEFIDKNTKENVRQLRVETEAFRQGERDRELPMYCVRVYERLGKQAFDVCPIENPNGVARNQNFEWAMYYDDLPEGVLGKLSTLSICEDGAYVPQIGYRHSEAVFYVTQ